MMPPKFLKNMEETTHLKKMHTLSNKKDMFRMLDTRYPMDTKYPKHVFLKTSDLIVYACIFVKCDTGKSVTKFSQYRNG